MILRTLIIVICFFASLPSANAAACLDVFPSGWREFVPEEDKLINFPPNGSGSTLASGTVLPRGDNLYNNSGLANKGTILVGSPTATETTARLFFRSSVAWQNVKINENGKPEDLIIVVDAGLQITGGSTVINAIIYVKGTVSVSGNATVNGALAVVGNSDSLNVNYNESNITNADFNGMCDNTPAPPAVLIANYYFDECAYSGTGFEVIDQAGNYSATSHGDVNTFDEGQVERGIELTDEDHHVETSIPLTGDFSVSTWFKSPSSIEDNEDEDNGNQYFVLGAMESGGDLLYIDRNDEWTWGVYNADENDSEEGEFGYEFQDLDDNWHHMALVYSGGKTKLYIDGKLEDQVSIVPSGTLKYIGTSFDGVDGNNPQGFRAPLDEFIVFKGALTSTEILNIYTNQSAGKNYDNSSRDPVNCLVLPTTEYRFDEILYEEKEGEILDTIGGLHGKAISSQPVESGKVCNAIDLSNSGIDDYAILDDAVLNNKSDFSVSVWVKTSKTGYQSILSGAGVGSPNEFLMWFINDTLFSPYLKNRNNGGIRITSIADDEWQHLVWTRKGSQSCLFVNKVLKNCVTQSTANLEIDSLILGQEQDNVGGGFQASQGFEGLLDELLIFDSAITLSQITTIYDNQDAGLGFDGEPRVCESIPLTLPVLDMRFDEVVWNATNPVLDSSENNFHGNAVNVNPTAGFICNAADLTAQGIDDYITLDERSLDERKNFSISLWYKTPKTGNQSLISGANLSSMNELIFWFNNDAAFDPYLKNTHNQPITTSSIAGDTWHHLVWTRSGRDNLFYHDGILQTGSSNLPSTALSISHLILGQEQDSLGGSFDPGQAVEGLIDELLVFKRVLSDTEVSDIFSNQTLGLNYDGSQRADCLPLFDHFQIDIKDAQGLTCAADNIVIKACADADCDSVNPDPFSVDLFVGANKYTTVNVEGDDGTAVSYVYDYINPADRTVELSLDQTYKCKSDAGSTSCEVDFKDTGFIISEIPMQISGRPSESDGTTFSLQAVEKDNDTGACTGAFPDGGRIPVNLSYSCNDGNCTNNELLLVNDNVGNSLNLTKIAYDLSFNTDSRAFFTLNYPDAGKIILNVQKDVEVEDSEGNTIIKDFSAVSNAFVVKPFGFFIDVKDNEKAESSGGNKFKKAGEDFSVTLSAVAWDNLDDSDNDGLPDEGADLSNNAITKGFGRETTPETAVISHGLVAPDPGVLGDLTSDDGNSVSTFIFNNGVGLNETINYSEVGIINLIANLSDNSYLGESDVQGNEPYVGRFYPDHFIQTILPSDKGSLIGMHDDDPTLMCSALDWVYSGQQTDYQLPAQTKGSIRYADAPKLTITAQNSDGDTTVNYNGDFAKLLNVNNELATSLNKITFAAPLTSSRPLTGDVTGTGDISGAAGVLTYELPTLHNFVYTRDTDSEIAPFYADFILPFSEFRDFDGVTFKPSSGGIDYFETPHFYQLDVADSGSNFNNTIQIFFGRAYLANSYGPETSDISLPLMTQYLDENNSFTINTHDVCTPYNSSNIMLTTIDFDEDLSGVNSASGHLKEGETRAMKVTKPSDGSLGGICVEYETLPWLQYKWAVDKDNLQCPFEESDIDGLFNDNPYSIATFGLYRGNDRIIYQREVERIN